MLKPALFKRRALNGLRVMEGVLVREINKARDSADGRPRELARLRNLLAWMYEMRSLIEV